MTQQQASELAVHQGEFGLFTITTGDRTGVLVYRAGLAIAALSFALGSLGVLWQGNNAVVLQTLNPLTVCFCLGLGISLFTIHIYLVELHRLLQVFWAIGFVSTVVLALQSSEPVAIFVYDHPVSLFGVGFMFAALTGIYFKEAFCFHRLETKLLTPLVPTLLLGCLVGVLPVQVERVLLGVWAVLFVVFALRKAVQQIPADIGDKSVFAYLKEQRSAKA